MLTFKHGGEYKLTFMLRDGLQLCPRALALGQRKHEKHFPAAWGVTLCPAIALFAKDELGKNNAEKALSHLMIVQHLL